MGIQSEAFLNGEANAWYHRNKYKSRPDEIIPLLGELRINVSSVLEIGCADGRRLGAMRKIYPDARLMGADPSVDAIHQASKKYPDIKFVREAAHTLYEEEGRSVDLLIYGFCLYLQDREELSNLVCNTDFILTEGGHLIIHDFDPEKPIKVPYEHEEGLFSYKMDYSALWLANPAYTLVKKVKPTPETAVWVLKKDTEAGWPLATTPPTEFRR